MGHRLVAAAAISLGVLIPLSTALAQVAVALIVIGALMGHEWQPYLRAFRHHPLVRPALALLAVLLASLLYGAGRAAGAGNLLGKYADLLLIPLLAPTFADPVVAKRAWRAFEVALITTLALSFALALHGLPGVPFVIGRPSDATIFKDHITQNILMAFVAFVFALRAFTAPTRGPRLAYGLLATLAVIDVVWLVHGRSGDLVLAALALYLGAVRGGRRGLVAALVLGALIAGGALAVSPGLRVRAETTLVHAEGAWAGHDAHTSVGERIGFYRTTLAVIDAHPVRGVGVGGFAPAYRAAIAHTGALPTANPHNQYLLVWAEAGIPGLLALLALGVLPWRAARRLPADAATVARGLLLAIAVGCMVNSLLIDFTERLFFAWAGALWFASAVCSPGRCDGPLDLVRRV